MGERKGFVTKSVVEVSKGDMLSPDPICGLHFTRRIWVAAAATRDW